MLDTHIQEPSFKYTKESFKYFVVSLGLSTISIIGIIISMKIKSQNGLLSTVIGLPFFAILLTSLIGFRGAILSFIKKEPNQTKKIIGLVGNLLFIILFLSMVIVNLIALLNL